MGIFSGLFRSRDKPQDRTAGSGFAFYLGGTTSGKTVTERSAMQMTAVYSCVRILAEAVAGLPLHLYQYTGDGGKEKAMAHMAVTLEEMKTYLRVDYEDDDSLIEGLLSSAGRLCLDVLRTDDPALLDSAENGKTAVMYAAAYLYEHREEADHRALTLTLRALLFGARKEGF